jgi:hypothetical protein
MCGIVAYIGMRDAYPNINKRTQAIRISRLR